MDLSVIASRWVSAVRAVAVSAAAWTALTIGATLATRGLPPWPQSTSRTLGFYLVASVPWMLGTPVLIALARRLPLTRQRAWTVLAAYALVGLTWVVIAVVAASSAVAVVFGGGAPEAWRRVRLVLAPRGDIWLDLVAFWIVVLGTNAWVAYTRLREREARSRELELRNAELQAQLSQAHLQMLRARLEPHFLFNTLNSVTALIRRGDTKVAISMLAHLGELLRIALQDNGQPFASVRQELDLIERYLEIQRLRFGDRLHVDVRADEASLSAAIPHLALQPIVENAIEHGIAGTPEPGEIRIVSHVVGRRLAIEVVNTGPPLPAGWVLDAAAGVGLSVTRARIARLYGPDASLALENVSDGVRARLELPLSSAVA